jgi:hypothetical protein
MRFEDLDVDSQRRLVALNPKHAPLLEQHIATPGVVTLDDYHRLVEEIKRELMEKHGIREKLDSGSQRSLSVRTS